MLDRAGVAAGEVTVGDVDALRESAPEILEAVRRLLARVHAGELGRPDDDRTLVSARIGWL